MKSIKITAVLFFLTFIIISFAHSSEELNMFKRLYYQAYSFKEKLDVLNSMIKSINNEYTDFVFNLIVEQSNMTFKQEESRDYEKLVVTTSMLVGKLQIEDAARYLTIIYNKCQTPIYKGEVLNQLGKTGNKEYLAWLNNEFYRLNNIHRKKSLKGQEEIIHGIILGLGNFNDKSSFEHLLYAATPHYSDNIQAAAQKVIDSIPDDAALLCEEIIQHHEDFDLKIDALNFALKSKSSRDNKLKICKSTINLMLGSKVPFLIQEKRKELLNKSVYYLGITKADDEESLGIIENKWNNEKDLYSIMFNIEALENIGTDKAAVVLMKKLQNYNNLKKQGAGIEFIDADELKIILAIIKSLGNIKYRGSLEVLYDTTWTESYGNTVKEEALRSINKILGKTKE